MPYHSTRSSLEKVGSKEAILKGLCPDGGLYVSDDLKDAGLDMDLHGWVSVDGLIDGVNSAVFSAERR